jgi:cyclopropane fatty-acyl-phospholipid synthase-like methyltransferase
MSMNKREGEAQYEELIAQMRQLGPEKLGVMTGWGWYDDPKRLVFTLSRYKFVAKMLEDSEHVLEVGCGDAFGTRIVAQSVKKVTAVDFDPELLESAAEIMRPKYPIVIKRHDMMAGPVDGQYSAAYCMDVLEHIQPQHEDTFMRNLVAPLVEDGVCIVGTPSLESQAYASKFSKMGHVNCKTQKALRDFMQGFFRNVFMFSMNDEVVHTGYGKMAHYNLALCCGRK